MGISKANAFETALQRVYIGYNHPRLLLSVFHSNTVQRFVTPYNPILVSGISWLRVKGNQSVWSNPSLPETVSSVTISV